MKTIKEHSKQQKWRVGDIVYCAKYNFFGLVTMINKRYALIDMNDGYAFSDPVDYKKMDGIFDESADLYTLETLEDLQDCMTDHYTIDYEIAHAKLTIS